MRDKAFVGVLVTALGMVWAPACSGNPPAAMPAIGQPAPDFTLVDQNDKQVRLRDFKGKQAVVMAWYVKAKTGG